MGNPFYAHPMREPARVPDATRGLGFSDLGGISLEGNVTPPAAPAIEIPPYREAESAPAPPVESAGRRRSPAPESPRPRSSAGPAVAVVLAVLLAAGGYLGLTTSGRKTLERAIPGVAALWGGNRQSPRRRSTTFGT